MAVALVDARADDAAARDAVAKIACRETELALVAERAFLTVLDGSCRTPIAGFAQVRDGQLTFAGMVLRIDGSGIFVGSSGGPEGEAREIGAKVGNDILRRLPAGLLGH